MADRVALYHINHNELITMLRAGDGRQVYHLTSLPTAPELLDLWGSDRRGGGLWLKIRSPDHAEVADGEEYPEAGNIGVLYQPPESRLNAVEIARKWIRDWHNRHIGEYPDDFRIAVEALIQQVEGAGRREAGLRQEVEQLRLLFGDYRLDNDDVDLAYQQGWREAMAQRDLKDGREKPRRRGGESMEDLRGELRWRGNPALPESPFEEPGPYEPPSLPVTHDSTVGLQVTSDGDSVGSQIMNAVADVCRQVAEGWRRPSTPSPDVSTEQP